MQTDDIRARISELAGKINRHKNEQQTGPSTAPQTYHYAPYHPFRRNNVWTAPGQLNAAATRGRAPHNRHVQAVDVRRERANLFPHGAAGRGRAGVHAQGPGHAYELVIEGTRFLVTKNGSKLVKVPGDGRPVTATPKTATVGGVKFCRSKRGNLYRHGVVQAQRRSAPVNKIHVPCSTFSTTGSCPKGPACRFLHDPDKVAVCKTFLLKGDCPSGDDCDLSHSLGAERTPHCVHFAKDSCTKPDCKYAHVKVSPAAPLCESFGIRGYCAQGVACPARHVLNECPYFSNTGVCRRRDCKLLHRERASVLRKKDGVAAADMAGLSSDDGEFMEDKDVDSDELDEFVGPDDTLDIDFSEQRDYVAL